MSPPSPTGNFPNPGSSARPHSQGLPNSSRGSVSQGWLHHTPRASTSRLQYPPRPILQAQTLPRASWTPANPSSCPQCPPSASRPSAPPRRPAQVLTVHVAFAVGRLGPEKEQRCQQGEERPAPPPPTQLRHDGLHPAAGRWGLAIRCGTPLGAHAHCSASLSGAGAHGTAALALRPEPPGSRCVGPSVCGLSASYAHSAGERSSLARLSPASDTQRLPHRSEPRHTSRRSVGAGANGGRLEGATEGGWPGRGGAHLRRRGAQSPGAGRRHLWGSAPPTAHLSPPAALGKGRGLRWPRPGRDLALAEALAC